MALARRNHCSAFKVAIAQVLEILDGEFVAQEGGLALQAGDDQPGLGDVQLCSGNLRGF